MRCQDISKADKEVCLTPQEAVLIPVLVATEVFDLGGLEWMLILNRVAEAEQDLSDLDIEKLSEVNRTRGDSGGR